MNENQRKTYIVLHMLLFAYSFGGISSKLASQQTFFSWKFALYYGIVLGMLVCYAFLWQQIIKRISLVTAYANKSVTVLWGILWGRIFFQESVSIKKCLGAALIVAGIVFVVCSEKGEQG